MSVNQGFATKALETQYSTVVYNLLYLLQYRVKRMYCQENVNEANFRRVLVKTYKKAKKMEIDKFLPPKFSDAMKDLADLLFTQSRGITETAESRIGLASQKSEGEQKSQRMLLDETSPRTNEVVQLPQTVIDQRSYMNSARTKISSQGHVQKSRKSVLLPSQSHVQFADSV